MMDTQKLTANDPDYHCRSGSEHGEQTALFCYRAHVIRTYPGTPTAAAYGKLFAVPNGGERQGAVAASMVAEGTMRGIPDTFLPHPIGLYHGLFIEMKRRREFPSTVSKEQRDRLLQLQSDGYAVYVCYGYKEAANTIDWYLSGKTIFWNGGTGKTNVLA